MKPRYVGLVFTLTFGLFSFGAIASTDCLQVEGEYSLTNPKTGELLLMHVEQKGCNQVNVVYDWGENGKNARIMMFNGRPVFYADTLKVSYYETYRITKDQIQTHSVEINREKNEEIHAKSFITLDENKNWVEEVKVFEKDHENEGQTEKVVYKRIK
jgi:hypothetical protein